MAESLFILCPACGATNRALPEKVNLGEAVCGRCKAVLPKTATPLITTDANFAATVERSPLPVLVDFWAAWCGPCRMIAPAIEELASELNGRMRVAKLNIDENPSTATRYKVQSIPTLLILQNGREIDRIVGAQPKAAILQRVQLALS